MCGRLAEEEAYAAVEALRVRAGGRAGEQRALLQQGERVGRAVAQRVGAAAQLLAAVRIHAVDESVWRAEDVKRRCMFHFSEGEMGASLSCTVN